MKAIVIPTAIALLLLAAVTGCGMQEDDAEGGVGHYVLLWSSSDLEARDSDPRASLQSVAVGQADGALEVSFIFGPDTLPLAPEDDDLELALTHLEGSTPDVYRLDVVMHGMQPSFEAPPENVIFEHPLLMSLRLDAYPEKTAFTADFTADVQAEFFVQDAHERSVLLLVIRDR